MATDGARRSEILETAASLFASSGLQTSLKEIADACGILPGSLYHHFESKEAIILELVSGFLVDLDHVASEALATLNQQGGVSIEAQIIDFGRAIAACGVRHRAALILTLNEPPTVLGNELARLANRTPVAIESAMLELLRKGRSTRVVRSRIDLSLLSERLCQSMLHVGVGVSQTQPGGERVPELRLRIPLHGVASAAPSNSALDRSAAFRAVQSLVAALDHDHGEDDRVAHLRSAARKEFGRRGYEATTIRDIASAAGLSTGAVYRSFGSKEDLLLSIMSSYSEKVKDVWSTALNAASSPLEKLDALIWANIQIVDQFSDEFRIQLAWLRHSPPSAPDIGLAFSWHVNKLKKLVAEGARSGEFVVAGPTAELRARCLYETIMFPPNAMRTVGDRAVLAFARDTVLRGALIRPRGHS